MDLINKEHVAPSAADTNDNGDFSRDQFLQGKIALFQSGAYNPVWPEGASSRGLGSPAGGLQAP